MIHIITIHLYTAVLDIIVEDFFVVGIVEDGLYRLLKQDVTLGVKELIVYEELVVAFRIDEVTI